MRGQRRCGVRRPHPSLTSTVVTFHSIHLSSVDTKHPYSLLPTPLIRPFPCLEEDLVGGRHCFILGLYSTPDEQKFSLLFGGESSTCYDTYASWFFGKAVPSVNTFSCCVVSDQERCGYHQTIDQGTGEKGKSIPHISYRCLHLHATCNIEPRWPIPCRRWKVLAPTRKGPILSFRLILLRKTTSTTATVITPPPPTTTTTAITPRRVSKHIAIR